MTASSPPSCSTDRKAQRLDPADVAAARAIFTALSQEEDLRCILLRGAGEQAFSPGNDISEFATERKDREQAVVYGGVMATTAKGPG